MAARIVLVLPFRRQKASAAVGSGSHVDASACAAAKAPRDPSCIGVTCNRSAGVNTWIVKWLHVHLPPY
eukprot:scaffold3768_cov376-Prasinococcus_capsulatus_cf.AAC.10